MHRDAIAAKTLRPILEDFWLEPLPIYALFPARKRLNKKAAVVVEALRHLLARQA
jgi:hypothetical protein